MSLRITSLLLLFANVYAKDTTGAFDFKAIRPGEDGSTSDRLELICKFDFSKTDYDSVSTMYVCEGALNATDLYIPIVAFNDMGEYHIGKATMLATRLDVNPTTVYVMFGRAYDGYGKAYQCSVEVEGSDGVKRTFHSQIIRVICEESACIQKHNVQTDSAQTQNDHAKSNQTQNDHAESAQTQNDQTDRTQTQKDQAKSNQTQKDEAKSTQTQKDEAKSTQTQKDQAKSNQTQKDEAKSTQIQMDQAKSTQKEKDQAKSTQTQKDQAKSTQTQKDQAKSTQTQKDQAKSTQTQKDEAKSTKTQKDQAKSTQTQKDQAKSTQKEKDQAKATQTQKDQAKSTETQKDQAKPTQTQKDQAKSTQTQKDQAKSTQTQKDQAKSTQAQKDQAESKQTQNDQTESTQTQKNVPGTAHRMEKILSTVLSLDKKKFHVSDLYQGHIYIASKKAVEFSLYDTNHECKDAGGYLVELDDKDEQNFVKEFLEATGHRRYWTGGNDIDSEGNFFYYTSKKRVENVTWKEGEPNNYEDEDCLEILSGQLNDMSCYKSGRYTCEIPLF